ncbi:squalene synthase HpnC [Orrella sp. 11846]|uniref:squalene synthase HpnC n=1 Tax=Orrella sp. 11846 TaxID=3409913 RepID=UPI003B5C73AE
MTQLHSIQTSTVTGVDHYENFPVASVLMPRRIRKDVVHIYWFARTADDLADEGDASDEERLNALVHYRERLFEAAQTGTIKSEDTQLRAIFIPLAQTIQKHDLPVSLLNDLLLAFEQDITVKRYATQAQQNDYCQRSANPIGRLLLHLFGQTDEIALTRSDAICTALQRINFLQDVAIDWKKGRVYLPQDAMAAVGVDETQIAAGLVNENWRQLMGNQVLECKDLLNFGRPLTKQLKGRVALEIKMIVQGGMRVLEKLESVDYDVFTRRPTLTRTDWLKMALRALW